MRERGRPAALFHHRELVLQHDELNTKRALVEKDGIIEWVSGSFGSHVSMLYPCSILHGENARCEFTGVTFASKGQHLDTGASV